MRTALLTSCMLYTILSCNSKTAGVQSVQADAEENGLSVSLDKKIEVGKTLIVEARNTSNKNIIIYGPMSRYIEKKEGGNWRKIKIQYCPCGANCLPPPKEKILAPGDMHIIQWDLTESWCGKVQEKSIPETNKEIAKPGVYHIIIKYSYLGEVKKDFIKEFNIIK